MISAKKLIKMFQNWQKFTALNRKRISFPRNNNHDCCALSVVDKGHFAIYTADQSRFVVPLAYLNNPVFRQLLKMSEEEYGLPSDGPIVLPCDLIFMDYVICLIRQGRGGDLHEPLLKLVARSRCLLSCLHTEVFRQLLQMSEDEFGLPSDWPITLPCDGLFMNYIIPLIQRGVDSNIQKALLTSVTDSRCSSSSLRHKDINQLPLIY